MVKNEVFDVRPACVGSDKLCDLYDFILLICRVEAAIALILRVVGKVKQYKANQGLIPWPGTLPGLGAMVAAVDVRIKAATPCSCSLLSVRHLG